MKTLLSAAWVAPMNGPPSRDWAIVVDPRQVVAVGPVAQLRRDHPDAERIELGDAIILPGLVNAHTHLELTSIGQLPRPASFVDWLLALRQRMGGVADLNPFITTSTREGVWQCLRFGVTAIGDVALNPAVTRPEIATAGLRGVSYGEVLGMAGRSAQMETRIAAAIDDDHKSDTLRVGIEPHAPYSLDLTGFRRCLEIARAHDLPLATHLAETRGEEEFLAHHTGPFRELWQALGGWEDGVSRAAGGPIRAMQQLGLFDYPTLLAHVNYADDGELDIVAAGQASVVYCPRTHAYFGHPLHPFEEMLRRNINVAIGTDSAASSGDLNIVDDLRLIHRDRPQLDPELLWSLITRCAARALRADSIGQLAEGAAADLCVFDVKTRDPLREILEMTSLPREVWLGGKNVYAAAP